MKTKIALTYKVSLAKTRFILKADGSYKMGAPMFSFDGPEFLTEKLAQDYIKLRIKETKPLVETSWCCKGEIVSDRMFMMKSERVAMLYTYSVVSVMVGIPAEE